ncbi:unnamed protein product [Echinostoma caproni]|uniref:Uncharacterized protein n=1 Tax=Echinostoma caproni TaxID=27848 RepID=A0A183AWU5_9TREM|nr:unnamed protein product [Echinostoma caproni]
MSTKSEIPRNFIHGDNAAVVTFVTNGVSRTDSLDGVASLNGTLDLDSPTLTDRRRLSTHRISLEVPDSSDQGVISPSKRFEKVSMSELKQALPSQSSVLGKVMFVQSRCAVMNSGLCDGHLQPDIGDAALTETVTNTPNKESIRASARTEKVTLLERLLGCIRPLTIWWTKPEEANSLSSGRFDQQIYMPARFLYFISQNFDVII